MDAAQRQSVDRMSGEGVRDASVAAAMRRGFYTLVAYLERMSPEAARIGLGGPPRAESIRFRHDPALVFSAADVQSVAVHQASDASAASGDLSSPRYEITTTFLGLTGATSPLPEYLVEDVLSEQRSAERDFLDLFHHRLLSLLYRLVMKYDVAADFQTDGGDAWSRRIVALGGTDAYAENSAGASPLPTLLLLRLAPVLAVGPRNARSLRLVLEEVLRSEIGEASCAIDEFVGAWVALESDERMRLGQVNHRLGQGSLLGRRIFDASAKFRVRIGPVTRAAYDRLRPEGDLFPVVKHVVERMLGNRLAFELEIAIATDAVPAFKLSAASGMRLGHSTWLGGAKRSERRVVLDVAS